jgi:GNAT superfamily N-acetyltransferase
VTAAPVLRAGRDDDAAGFIALIGACWAEYPGCIMDLDGEVPELRALASYYASQGGALWAAEADGAVVGMVATRPLEDGAWEICKMYVAAAHRGAGLANALIDAAEAHARAGGAQQTKLWTDTRFERAHRFYEKRGYVRHGPLRALNDKSNSVEYHYIKP